MIDWWQKRIAEKYDYSGIKVWDREELIAKYDTDPDFKDGGDYVWRALEWTITNTVKNLALTKPGDKPGGYGYYQTADDPSTYLISIRGYLNSYRPNVEEALKAFMDAKGNAIAAVSSTGHAWTLYGVEFDTETQKYTRVWATDPVPDDMNKKEKKLHTFDVMYSNSQGKDQCYFLRYIHDEENNSWNPQEIEPAELTLLRIDDALLVDKDGNAVFKVKSDSDTGEEKPAFNPVRPGEEQACATRPEAEKWVSAVNQDKSKLISPPEALPEGFRTRYVNLFEARVRERADGQFAVAVALKAEAEESVREGIEGFGDLDVRGLSAQDQEATVQTVPGLYYSVLAGSLPGDLAVKSCTMAEGETLKLAFPKLGKSAFYQIKTTVSAETVAP